MSREIHHEESVINLSDVQSEGISKGRKGHVSISDGGLFIVPPVGSKQIVIVDFVQQVKLFVRVRIDRCPVKEDRPGQKLEIRVRVLVDDHDDVVDNLKGPGVVCFGQERTNRDGLEVLQRCHVQVDAQAKLLTGCDYELACLEGCDFEAGLEQFLVGHVDNFPDGSIVPEQY